MTKEERQAKIDAGIEAMIDRFDMTTKCNLSREAISKKVKRGMILNNLAFVLADAANSALMDMESELTSLGVAFNQSDKYNFKQMLSHVDAAKKWAEKSALPIYKADYSEDMCADSDWWYNMIKLIDDRLGEDKRKTNMFLEYLLAMPSEIGIFDLTYNDFKQFKHD